MGEFDYEKSIWGHGRASLNISAPTSFRLRQSLQSFSELKSGAKVLELGCGAGQFIRGIKAIRPELACYGCDISQSALEAAKQANDGVAYKLSMEKTLPYENGLFDAVLIFDVLEHVEDPDAILAEINRVMKINGGFYCFAPCEGDFLSLWHWVKKLAGEGRELTKKYAGHINYFSRRSLFDLVKKNNFNIARVRYSEHFFGQLLGIAIFIAMDRAVKKKKLIQINNETYFAKQKHSPLLKFLKNIINAAIYLESAVFSRVPSPNVHLVVKKP